MKFLSEFRNAENAATLIRAINANTENRRYVFMEVCGTHTMSIARFGIKSLLPESVKLVSGPGCPVCVTPNYIIDYAVKLSEKPNVILTTFGDMMKVPGSYSSLEKERAKGRRIRVVTSTLDAMSLAVQNKDSQIIFLGVGFETTAPTVAAAIMEAGKRGLDNFSVLCAHKTMPMAMEAISEGGMAVNGYICPGHVSAIIGSEPYKPLADKHKIACVIGGFEPVDILQSILMLVKQINSQKPVVEIQYSRAVKPHGNSAAVDMINTVFEPCDSEWRGIGLIPSSGLRIRDEYKRLDAAVRFPVELDPVIEPEGCRCGEVLQGKITPEECALFASICTPDAPVGPCMVSSEGTCAAWYQYNFIR